MQSSRRIDVRWWVAMALAVGLVAAACSDDGGGASSATTTRPTGTASAAASVDPAMADELRGIVEQQMAEQHLKAAIVRVTVDGEEVLTQAWGESMAGVPATTDMSFRNGAVAISYVATVLLQLVDEGVVGLDDPVSTWLPEVAHADRVTLRQLATMTSGYHDYVKDPAFGTAIYADPFRVWTPEELVTIGTTPPLWYEPGTNWNYAHTNYVVLGLALEEATGTPMTELVRERVLEPLGLERTGDPGSPWLPEPVLHSYSSERKEALGIPEGTSFYEEATYWDPSWTITHGAIQYTDIVDMERSAVAVGTGELLTPEGYELMTSTAQRDFGGPVEGCDTCRRGDDAYTYGMGIAIKGEWLYQNPAFAGRSGVMAYLPSERIAISIVTTFEEEYYTDPASASQPAMPMFLALATALAPDQAPPA